MIEKYIKSVLISAILTIALVTYRKIPSAYLENPARVQYFQAISQRYRQEAKHYIKSKPGGLPNYRGTCAMNAFLQVLAAHYPTFFDEHKWSIQHKHRRLATLGRKIISRINSGQNVSTQAVTNFDRQLQKLKTITTRGGIYPFYFIRDLFYYVNVANFKFVSCVEDFPTSPVTSNKQKKYLCNKNRHPNFTTNF